MKDLHQQKLPIPTDTHPCTRSSNLQPSDSVLCTFPNQSLQASHEHVPLTPRSVPLQARPAEEWSTGWCLSKKLPCWACQTSWCAAQAEPLRKLATLLGLCQAECRGAKIGNAPGADIAVHGTEVRIHVRVVAGQLREPHLQRWAGIHVRRTAVHHHLQCTQAEMPPSTPLTALSSR